MTSRKALKTRIFRSKKRVIRNVNPMSSPKEDAEVSGHWESKKVAPNFADIQSIRKRAAKTEKGVAA
jgi:hypothetical protein